MADFGTRPRSGPLPTCRDALDYFLRAHRWLQSPESASCARRHAASCVALVGISLSFVSGSLRYAISKFLMNAAMASAVAPGFVYRAKCAPSIVTTLVDGDSLSTSRAFRLGTTRSLDPAK